MDEIDADRKKKLDELLAKGVNPYPYQFGRTHYAKQVHADFTKLENTEVSVAGRLMTKRAHGKLIFADLQDVTGRIQVAVRFDSIGEEKFNFFSQFDPGDIIGVKGKVFKTKRGEDSVMVDDVSLLAKSLRALPEKWHGIADVDMRYRQRYLDLIMNPRVLDGFILRSKMITAMREFLDANDFIEAETPVLQSMYGGAAARPFKTHHNALDADLFLRIADELYLKRLVIGGMERVYEFGKDFRNEDIDSRHNPEFTMLEFYAAYWDYTDVMNFAEGMVNHVVKKLHNSSKVAFQEKELDFAAPWPRISFVKEIERESGVDPLSFKTDEEAREVGRKLKLEFEKWATRGHIIDNMFDHFVLPKLFRPTFVMDYPEFMCPLTKAKRGDERISERFELFIAHQECGNAYSELTNPLEQRRKFEDQAKAKAKGDEEAQPFDEDFLAAMEYGMPPTGGMGIGVDRLAMLMTGNVSIKEVILFPSVKPKKG